MQVSKQRRNTTDLGPTNHTIDLSASRWGATLQCCVCELSRTNE